MLPIVLKSEIAAIGLAGAGEGLSRRLALLSAAGIRPRLIAPEAPLDGLSVLFVAGLDRATAEALAARARAASILINVEDVPALCDFNVPAIHRQGDLMFSVSTGGRAPALASMLREWLEPRFGPEWVERVAELGEKRELWRQEKLAMAELGARARAFIASKGWLK